MKLLVHGYTKMNQMEFRMIVRLLINIVEFLEPIVTKDLVFYFNLFCSWSSNIRSFEIPILFNFDSNIKNKCDRNRLL